MKHFIFIIIIFVSLTELVSQNKVELNLNFNEGDTFLTKYKLASSSFQEVNGEQQIVKKEISYSLLFNVLPSISDSTFYIKTTYKRILHIYDILNRFSQRKRNGRHSLSRAENRSCFAARRRSVG